MKGNLSMDTQVWSESWFRGLRSEVKLFWMFLQADCDIAGWWNPDWDLVAARLKVDIDPQAIRISLEDAGQIIVHKSGWWELTEYCRQQYPNGLKQSSGYHKGALKLLDRHHRREGIKSETPKKPGALPQEAGLDPQADDTPGGETATEPQGWGSGAPPEPHRAKSPSHSHSPSHGLGLGAQAPSPSHGHQFPTGGLGESTAAYEGLAREVALAALHQQAHDAGMNLRLDDAEKAFGRLLDAFGAGGAAEQLAAALKALERPTADSLGYWVRLKLAECPHPDARRTWWTAACDEHVHGVKQRRWRCGICGHVEDHGEPYQQRHTHEWGETIHAPRVVADGHGHQVHVQAFQRCKLCGSERQAPQSDEGSEGVAA